MCKHVQCVLQRHQYIAYDIWYMVYGIYIVSQTMIMINNYICTCICFMLMYKSQPLYMRI